MVSFSKKWDQRRPLFLQQNKKITRFFTSFPFPFPIIPGNNNVSFPFPKVGNGICHSRSRSQKLGMEFVIPVPIPKSWECYFSFPFPFPKFGNGLSNSRSRSQSQKTIPAHPWLFECFMQSEKVYHRCR